MNLYIEHLVKVLHMESQSKPDSAATSRASCKLPRSFELFQRHGLLQPRTARATVASLLGTFGHASQAWSFAYCGMYCRYDLIIPED